MAVLEALPGEEWRCIEHAPGYRVSNMGRVASKFGGILKERLDKGGYRRVVLYKPNPTSVMIHRLVCEAFIGPRPEGCEVNHRNAVRHDNQAGNLEWVTRKQNAEHRERGEKHSRGQNNANAKLTEKSVNRLRTFLDAGARHRCAANIYGISKSMVSCISRRQNWA